MPVSRTASPSRWGSTRAGAQKMRGTSNRTAQASGASGTSRAAEIALRGSHGESAGANGASVTFTYDDGQELALHRWRSIYETHQHSCLHSVCVVRCDGSGAADAEHADCQQTRR